LQRGGLSSFKCDTARDESRARRKPGEIAPEEASHPMGQLIAGGADLSRTPRAAVEDFLANREPPPTPVGPRGRGSRRQRGVCVDDGEGEVMK
jgi:hypothetical protein